jgi:hypothetical protein
MYETCLRCFAGFLLGSDDHVYPAGAGNVDVWWKLRKIYASGVLWAMILLLLISIVCFSAAF